MTGMPVAGDSMAGDAMTLAPDLVEAVPTGRPTGLPWLPDRPPVNATAVRLSVRSPGPLGHAGTEGVPTPELFLLGVLDGTPGHTPEGPRLLVAPGAAIAAAMVSDAAPQRLRAALRVPHTYLIPAGWLDQARLHGAPDGGGPDELGHPPVLRCTGASHGIDGLPDDVVYWPRTRPARVFALRPIAGPASGFVRLHRRRPPVVAGHRLLQLRIRRAAAIDVRASASRIAGLTLVRSRLAELAATGVDLILTGPSAERVRVVRVFEPDGPRWRPVGTDQPATREGGSPLRTATASSARD
jgi:hypothetical protein